MAGRKHLVYEVRSEGRVLSQFSSETKAKKEMKKLRAQGLSVRVYSKWIGSETEAPKPRKALGRSVAPGKEVPCIDLSGYEVSPDAAIDLERYWKSISDPFFLGTYRDGRPCDPSRRDSDISVQPDGDCLKLCYRDVGRREVSVVLASVERVRIARNRLEISGRNRAGDASTVELRIRDQGNDVRGRDGPGFREGWYLVSNVFFLFVQESDEPLEPEYARDYDRYVDYSVVYPGFGEYAMDGGLMAYRDSGGLKGFLEENFQSSDAVYIDMPDPLDLRDALESGNARAIGRYASAYPELKILS